MKCRFTRRFSAASAGAKAEAASSCADSSDVMLVLGTVLSVSVFLVASLVRISVLALVLSVLLLARWREAQSRLKTQARMA